MVTQVSFVQPFESVMVTQYVPDERLIALEDFEGLQRRVVALTKERLACEVVMDTQKVEIEELRE